AAGVLADLGAVDQELDPVDAPIGVAGGRGEGHRAAGDVVLAAVGLGQADAGWLVGCGDVECDRRGRPGLAQGVHGPRLHAVAALLPDPTPFRSAAGVLADLGAVDQELDPVDAAVGVAGGRAHRHGRAGGVAGAVGRGGQADAGGLV